ncbi:unnamed protein product [Brassicogethes aeneus]|uniref:Uncharacterized protein n=1 Tax=Brassicogethes aeneus TaxID=1431903 RepID=A0A9P0BEQ4_BRAAE|nr:unnamed protein product [Brassicogethes aeneus]
MWKFVTFFLLASSAYAGDSYETFEPSSLETLDGHELLTKFVELVEKYNMNVTIIGNTKEYRKNGDVDETIAFGFTLPANETREVTDGHPTKEERQAFLDLAKESKIVAVTNVLENDKYGINSNWGNYDSTEDVYQKILKIEETVYGYKILTPSYRAQYNFIIPGDDGKNETIMALVANVEMDKVSNEGFTKEELQKIEEILKKSYIFTDRSADLAEIIKAYLNEKMPIEPKRNYFVFINPGQYYIESVKKAEFREGGENKIIVGIF